MAKGKPFGFVAGLIIGGIAGAAATIIFVPELDEETRRRLREEALRWRETIDKLRTNASAQADLLVDQGRQLIDEQRARFEEAVAAGREAAAEKQRELKAKFDQALRQGEAEL